jgi:hypothetical protein
MATQPTSKKVSAAKSSTVKASTANVSAAKASAVKSPEANASVAVESAVKASKIKNDLIYLVLLSIVFLISYSFIFDKKLDLNGDNFGYLNYAKAIFDGKGYVSPYSPSFPPTNWFPPGYSALLASLMFFFGDNIVLFKIFNGLLYFGAILLLYAFTRRITGNKPLAFTVATLLFLNSGLMRYATILMSEIPYLLLSTVAIYCLTKLEDDIKIWKNKWFWGLVLGSVGAFYFRSVALGLVGGVILYFLFDRKWKRMGSYVLSFTVLYLPWSIRDHAFGLKSRYFDAMTVANAWRPEEGHINTVSGFLEKIATNFHDTVIKGFTEVLFPFVHVETAPASTIFVLGVLILIVTFFGAWKTGKFRIFFGGYLLANIGVFLLWHSGNGSRYVWPLAPFIAVCFFLGLYELIRLILKKSKVKTGPALAFIFLAFAFLMTPKLKELNVMAKQDYDPAYKNYFEMAKAVKKNGSPEMMICCRKAEMFHYFSGTYAIMYKFSPDDMEVIRHMSENNVDYVVLEQLGYGSTGRYLYPAIIKHPELFQPVMHLQNPDTYLLAFNKEGAKKLLAGGATSAQPAPAEPAPVQSAPVQP